MEHSDDIVNLSPIRWLQDPLAEYKKNSDYNKYIDIRARISSLEVIDKVEAQKIFNIGNLTDLGICHLTKDGGWTRNENKIINKIVANTKETFRGKLDNKDHTGYGVVLHTFVGGSGRHFDGTFTGLVLCNGKRGDGTDYKVRETQCEGWNDFRIYNTINFKTKNEADNFKKYCESTFMKWFAITCIMNNNATNFYNYFPYLGDYTHPWTDDMLYGYFGLTEDEIQTIESEVE